MELESGNITRITPPGVDVFTPATSKGKDWVAVATPDQDGYRYCHSPSAANTFQSHLCMHALWLLCASKQQNLLKVRIMISLPKQGRRSEELFRTQFQR